MWRAWKPVCCIVAVCALGSVAWNIRVDRTVLFFLHVDVLACQWIYSTTSGLLYISSLCGSTMWLYTGWLYVAHIRLISYIANRGIKLFSLLSQNVMIKKAVTRVRTCLDQ